MLGFDVIVKKETFTQYVTESQYFSSNIRSVHRGFEMPAVSDRRLFVLFKQSFNVFGSLVLVINPKAGHQALKYPLTSQLQLIPWLALRPI